MKRILPFFCALVAAGTLAFGDDQTRNVQSELKNQGFYYGEVDGKSGPELSAALRRYQIRNGLEVSGDLNKETLAALGLGPAAPQKPAAEDQPVHQVNPPPASQTKPHAPVNIRRDAPQAEDGDRPVQEEPMRPPRGMRNPSVVPPPAPLDERNAVDQGPPAAGYARTFAGTPYASAPHVVQESTLRRAQQALTEKGFYRDPIDGQAGPATEEAVLAYQRNVRLPLTGRLDLQTLSSLRLLPGSGRGNPPLKPFNGADAGGPAGGPGRNSSRPVYRGVWVE